MDFSTGFEMIRFSIKLKKESKTVLLCMASIRRIFLKINNASIFI